MITNLYNLSLLNVNKYNNIISQEQSYICVCGPNKSNKAKFLSLKHVYNVIKFEQVSVHSTSTIPLSRDIMI